MSLNFPSSPIIDQLYSYGERTWKWNGIYWETANFTIGYTGSKGDTGNSIAVSNLYQAGNLIVFTGTQRWYAPYNLQFIEITARVLENANDDIEIEILKNDTLLTGLTIPVGLYTASTSGNDSTVLTMNEGDYITVDVLQVGTIVQPGSDLYLQFKYVNT